MVSEELYGVLMQTQPDPSGSQLAALLEQNSRLRQACSPSTTLSANVEQLEKYEVRFVSRFQLRLCLLWEVIFTDIEHAVSHNAVLAETEGSGEPSGSPEILPVSLPVHRAATLTRQVSIRLTSIAPHICTRLLLSERRVGLSALPAL